MAIRIKSKWGGGSAARAVADVAGALAFIIWRLSLEHAKELHRQGFQYESDRERIAVLTEFCAFQVHLCDRLAWGEMEHMEREALIVALGRRLADLMQENMEEIAGPGAYRAPFVAALNQRLSHYAGTTFADGEPGFDMLRCFGDGVLQAIGTSQTNRWILDQVMEISAPAVHERLAPAFRNRLDTR